VTVADVSIPANARTFIQCGRLIALLLIVAITTKRRADPAAAAGILASQSGALKSDDADALCDELQKHILDCEACINGREESCNVYRSFQERIAQAGGVTKSALLAI